MGHLLPCCLRHLVKLDALNHEMKDGRKGRSSAYSVTSCHLPVAFGTYPERNRSNVGICCRADSDSSCLFEPIALLFVMTTRMLLTTRFCFYGAFSLHAGQGHDEQIQRVPAAESICPCPSPPPSPPPPLFLISSLTFCDRCSQDGWGESR